jgi:hypothetical protein
VESPNVSGRNPIQTTLGLCICYALALVFEAAFCIYCDVRYSWISVFWEPSARAIIGAIIILVSIRYIIFRIKGELVFLSAILLLACLGDVLLLVMLSTQKKLASDLPELGVVLVLSILGLFLTLRSWQIATRRS